MNVIEYFEIRLAEIDNELEDLEVVRQKIQAYIKNARSLRDLSTIWSETRIYRKKKRLIRKELQFIKRTQRGLRRVLGV